MIEAIKKIVSNMLENSKLSKLEFGTVESVDPLKIRIEQKKVINDSQLMLSHLVRDYYVDITVQHSTDSIYGAWDTTHDHPDAGSNVIPIDHEHEYKGRKKIMMHYSLKKGEKVAIIGQNGAGKTTMVKMLNGLLKPVSGDVVVDDWNTKKYTVAKMSQKIGYVFQNPMDQIFHNNVYDEIAFGAKKLKYSPDETKKMVENAIKLTELEKYQKENPYNLPYSMRKFVTIAAVIAMGSDVIIMDEPTAGQDFRGMRVLHNLIDELQKQGKTIITITHDMEFVVKNFDRVIVMTNGKVIADGDKRDIFWQFDTLEKSMVKQPYISDLAKEMEMDGKVLSVKEFVENY